MFDEGLAALQPFGGQRREVQVSIVPGGNALRQRAAERRSVLQAVAAEADAPRLQVVA